MYEIFKGVALFIAAGNSAVSAQIGTPGSAEDVITVGSLDKNTAIAVYSSQGPTEEGRVKPNIAFVGSNVMAPDYNTGNGYTSKQSKSKASVGSDVLERIIDTYPELNPLWLMTGKGNMILEIKSSERISSTSSFPTIFATSKFLLS